MRESGFVRTASACSGVRKWLSPVRSSSGICRFSARFVLIALKSDLWGETDATKRKRVSPSDGIAMTALGGSPAARPSRLHGVRSVAKSY